MSLVPVFKPIGYDPNFVFSRSKMGVTITCHEVNKLFVVRCNGRLLHATSDDVRNDDTAREAAFYTAWQMMTGFVPSTKLRWTGKRFIKTGMSSVLLDRVFPGLDIAPGIHS